MNNNNKKIYFKKKKCILGHGILLNLLCKMLKYLSHYLSQLSSVLMLYEMQCLGKEEWNYE